MSVVFAGAVRIAPILPERRGQIKRGSAGT